MANETYLVHFYPPTTGAADSSRAMFASDDFTAAAAAYDKAAGEHGPGWLVLWNQRSRLKLQQKQLFHAPGASAG
ncbi:MAG: hypothetical protein ACK5XA_07250 [Tagaea sp.]